MAVDGGAGRARAPAVAATARSCWSGLPTDLLVLILKRLNIADYIRFGAVCAEWNSLAKSKLCRPASQVPWLMFPPGDVDDGRRSFLDVSTNETYTVVLPELRGRPCIGTSADGRWVVFVREDMELGVLNVFGAGGDQPLLPRPLPPMATLWDVKGGIVLDNKGRVAKYRLRKASAIRPSHLTFTPQEMLLRHFYRKAVVFQISSSSTEEEGSSTGTPAVAVIHGVSKTVSVARVGDADWKILSQTTRHVLIEIQDILFHGGNLFAVDVLGQSFAFDLRRPSLFGSCCAVPRELGMPRRPVFDQTYLVPSPSADHLVRVCRLSHCVFGRLDHRAWTVKVYRLVMAEGGWVEHKDWGGYMLFVGRNHPWTVALPTAPPREGIPQTLARNSVYFSHDDCILPDDDLSYKEDDHGLSVFSFEQGGCQALPWPSAPGKLGWPIWVAPPSLA